MGLGRFVLQHSPGSHKSKSGLNCREFHMSDSLRVRIQKKMLESEPLPADDDSRIQDIPRSNPSGSKPKQDLGSRAVYRTRP